MTVLALLLGAAVGAVLGLLGAGGSLLTVPALVLALGLTTTEATGTSLVAVAMMAGAGVVVHRRAGRCSCREGLAFGAAAAVTAVGAGWVASAVPDRVLTAAFVVLLVVTAVWLLRRDELSDRGSDEHLEGRSASPASAAAGAGVGVLTGLLGVGGGFLVVPALLRTRHLPMPMAVGTSQVVVLVSAVAGLAGRAAGGSVQWGVGLLFGMGGLLGATAGARLADRAPAHRLRQAFAGVAVTVAVVLGLRALSA